MYGTIRVPRAARLPRPTASARLRAARVGVFALYATAGLLVGVWSGSIPLVAHRAGVTPGVLGVLVLVSSAGIVAGANVGGRVQQRSGSIGLCICGLGLAGFGAFVVGFSGDAWLLCCAFTIFAFGMGLNDVGMNMQAVLVERAYRRPIMAAFHAFFSLGGAVGALTILVTVGLRWTVPGQLTFAGAVAVALVALAAPALVRKAEEPPGPQDAATEPATPVASAGAGDDIVLGPTGWPEYRRDTEPEPPRRARAPRVPMTRVAWLLGICALALMCTEGVAIDWSALQLTQAFGAAAGVSAFGYGVFAVAMTGGRLVVDRVAARVGPAAVLRAGALLGAAGLVVVVVSPSIWLALAGWGALGLGLCGGVPQVFTAAGNQQHSAVVLSRVLTLGYVGIFGGPALIGLFAQATSVTLAMLLPLVLLLVAVLAGGVLRSARGVTTSAPRLRSPRAPGSRQATSE